MIGSPWAQVSHITVDGLTRESYIETIKDLQRALAQFDAIKRGKAQSM